MRGLLYCIILFFITGCSFCNPQPRALNEAESLMTSDPKAALTSLNALDISEFNDSAIMARWALLYSEALVANQLSAPTDTIIDIAINYYKSRDIDSSFQKALRLKEIMQSSGNDDALATALYLQKEKEFFLYKERARRQQTTYVSLLILLIAAGIIIWMRQRIKLQSAQNDALIAEASVMKDRINSDRNEVGSLETKLQELLKSRFSLIDSLCQTYYEAQGTKAERNAIVNRVKAEIDAARSDSFPEMESAVNNCRNNLLEKVKAVYPTIKADDYKLLVYICGGLSSRTISLLLGEPVEIVYKRKSRLKARLKETAGTDCPEILTVF